MQTVAMNTLSKKDSEFLRAIIYGSAGCGKTTMIGTFPKPILVFNFDDKMKPLYGIDGIEAVNYPFDKSSECSKVWRQFLKDFREAKKDPKYKTLAMDSLTLMNRVLITHIMIMSGKQPEDKPTLPNYGEMKDMYEYLFIEMNKIQDKNVIMTAHIQEVYGEEDVLLERSPLITGAKIRAALPALFEELYYMERIGGVEDKRILYYRPHKKALANSLCLQGDGKIENPTYDKLVENIRRK